MHPLLFATTGTVISTPNTDAAMPFSSNSKPKSSNHAHISNCNSHSLSCKHSSSATLDLLILILVLFSGAFLLSSYFSYIFNSLSLLSHFTPQLYQFPTPQILGFIIFFVISILLVLFCCGTRSRKCGKPRCKGLKKAMEFDLQLQTEESLKTGSDEIDKLPWKGGSENNPDYECLSSELRNMAPPGGRAVLLFRTKCGCPVAKLEGWGPRKGKRHKKSLPNRILNGGGDHP